MARDRMTPPEFESLGLSEEERRFVRQLGADYRPEQMTPERRTAFDRTLLDRLETRQRRWILAPSGALAAVTAAWLFIVLAGPGSNTTPDPTQSPLQVAQLDRDPVDRGLVWERHIFYGSADPTIDTEDADDAEADDSGRGDALPPDYSAIGSLFLGDDDWLDG